MGRGLAKNMVAKGLDLCVADLDQSRVDHALSQGASPGDTPVEMAQACEGNFSIVVGQASIRECCGSYSGSVTAHRPDC